MPSIDIEHPPQTNGMRTRNDSHTSQLVKGVKVKHPSKTVVVLGFAYAGFRAALTLLCNLPHDWKIVVIDRNTHFNHLYVFPRLTVLQGHEHKAFIPSTAIFDIPKIVKGGAGHPPVLPFSSGPPSPDPKSHKLLHAIVHSISLPDNTVTYRSLESGIEGEEETLRFDYLVYALGSQLPQPIDTWSNGGTGVKSEAVAWMKNEGDWIKNASTPDGDTDVLVIGGGALGVQFASDIKDIYPEKHVILVHSRQYLLNRFDVWMHENAKKALEDMGVEVILGERVIAEENEEHTYHTTSGRRIKTDIVLKCTGQYPETAFLPDETLDPISKEAYVTRTLQLARKTEEGLLEPYGSGNVFVVGDAAQAFGARKAGNTAFYQAQLACCNVARLVYNASNPHEPEKLDEYFPPKVGIKVSLGRKHAIYQNATGHGHRWGDECSDLLGVNIIWDSRGCGDVERHL
ncbi:FAD/NAD(P)-binding domain-containing protein [Atractiella rhizophila]|nr:FAD/NAD(P)-binding domain-containing protein [Atractiella rhizophila]